MQETEDSKKILRGTASPVHPLSEAVSFLERVQAAPGEALKPDEWEITPRSQEKASEC